MAAMRPIVIGTAGHIDHGKSALVRALTGIDPDRLKEEKERGITIDLGFAHLRRGPFQLAFIDVPGHERFVKNMLAGAGGIDLVLLVVAADESIKPQTREHFEICRLLAVRGGVVALTKIDLVEPEIADLVELEVREALKGGFLARAPVIRTSSKTGAGLESLVAALVEAAGAVPPRPIAGPARLPIDRAFTLRGFGTIVTGTLASGTLSGGAAVTVLPDRLPATIRSIQVHGRAVARAQAGERVALNLAGIEVGALRRGQILSEPERLVAVRVVDTELELLADARPLRRRTRVRLHHFSAELLARVYPLGREALEPGARGWVRIHAEGELAALPGDQVIVRSYSPMRTIGGGAVIEIDPPRLKAAEQSVRLEQLARGAPAARLATLAERHGPRGLTLAELVQRSGWTAEQLAGARAAAEAGGAIVVLAGRTERVLARSALESCERRVLEVLEAFHRREPLQPGMPLEELRVRGLPGAPPELVDGVMARLRASGRLRLEGMLAAAAGFQLDLGAEGRGRSEALESKLKNAGSQGLSTVELMGPQPSKQAAQLLQLLLRRGAAVRAGEFYFHREVIERLKIGLIELGRRQGRIAVQDFKQLGGMSRRSAIPLLEYFDREGFTRRVGDARVVAGADR
jgi:selenocysteine-specific elongation factor